MSQRIATRQATGYNRARVKIRSFRKKDLRRFYEEGDARGLPPGSAAKLQAMFAVLDAMSDASEIAVLAALEGPHAYGRP